MADQLRWFKLWTSALDDPDLANLSIEDFGRWCAFGAYLKQHGTDGSIVLRPPAVYLCQRLRVPDMTALIACISSWPNVQIRRDADSDDPVTQATTVTWRNWRKYQRDSSATRMRAKRARDRISVTPKRRGEEKRGEKKHPTTTGAGKSDARGTLTIADITAKYGQASAYRQIDVQAAAERCLNWCVANRKPFSEKRAVNWLNGDALKATAGRSQEESRAKGRTVTRPNINEAWVGRTAGDRTL